MIRLARLFVLCTLVVGCEPPAPAPVMGTFPLEVGPAGGVIEGQAGTEFEGVKLEIPAGALTAKVTIDAAFTEEEPELAAGSFFVGPSFQFFPRAQTFAKPVKLTLPVATTTLDSFGQTTAECLMWMRADDGSWSQSVPVGFTETLVAVEATTLVQSAVGVKTQLIIAPLPTNPLVLPCTNPAGFCVDVNLEKLKAGNTGWSEIYDRSRIFYRRTEVDTVGGIRSWVVEYNLVSGRNAWESQAYVPPASTATNFAPLLVTSNTVVRGPDDAGWVPVAHGLVKFPVTGAPSLLADSAATGRTMAVAFTADGARHRQFISANTTSAVMRIATGDAAAVQVEQASGVFSGAEFPFFRMPTGNTVAWLWRTPSPRLVEALPPAAGATFTMHPDIDQHLSRAGVETVRFNEDGSLLAAITFGFPANLYLQSRDGLISRAVAGLPRLEAVEFGEPGFVWAAATSAAQVYRIEIATGAVQTVELTSSVDPAVIATRLPLALRHVTVPATATLPERHLMYVIAGASSSRSVLVIRTAQ